MTYVHDTHYKLDLKRNIWYCKVDAFQVLVYIPFHIIHTQLFTRDTHTNMEINTAPSLHENTAIG